MRSSRVFGFNFIADWRILLLMGLSCRQYGVYAFIASRKVVDDGRVGRDCDGSFARDFDGGEGDALFAFEGWASERLGV